MKERANLVKEIVKAINILKAESEVAEALNISISNTNAASEEEIIRLTEELEAAKRTIEELNRKAKEDEEYINSLRAENERHLNRIFDLTNPVVEDTKEYENVYCGECQEETKQEILNTKELKCTVCGETWERFTEEEIVKTKEEPKPETKKGADKKVTKKETKVNHKVSNVNKLVKCGHDEGENEVLFVEKRRDNKHLWYGQVRMNNEIRNFHWSNELPLPTVYGIENMESLKEANELIKAAVKAIDPKELTRYSQVPDDIDFGACKARHFYGALHQGAYIYMSPEMQAKNPKDTDIICKGYVCDHAFIVRRDGEVYWRHYNYIFSKKPFEHTASKGYNTKQMLNDVQILFDKVEDQFAKEQSKYERKQAKKNTKEDNKDKTKEEILRDADISDLFE